MSSCLCCVMASARPPAALTQPLAQTALLLPTLLAYVCLSCTPRMVGMTASTNPFIHTTISGTASALAATLSILQYNDPRCFTATAGEVWCSWLCRQLCTTTHCFTLLLVVHAPHFLPCTHPVPPCCCSLFLFLLLSFMATQTTIQPQVCIGRGRLWSGFCCQQLGTWLRLLGGGALF